MPMRRDKVRGFELISSTSGEGKQCYYVVHAIAEYHVGL